CIAAVDLDEIVVDRHIAVLVDDDRGARSGLREHPVEQRGLSRAEKTGEQKDGYRRRRAHHDIRLPPAFACLARHVSHNPLISIVYLSAEKSLPSAILLRAFPSLESQNSSARPHCTQIVNPAGACSFA